MAVRRGILRCSLKTFSFQLPTRIEFGNGVSRNVGTEAVALGGTRVLVVTDAGLRAAGLVDPVVADLEAAGLSAVIFDDVAPNPRDTSVAAGAELAAAEGADLLVAVGGGSPMDTAKGIGVIQANGGSIADYEGLDAVSKPITPLIAVPTTAGTGSEVTFWSVITDTARSFKMSVGSPLIAPRVALVDPELTLGLPAALTASTGMDALTHAIEGYTATLSEPLTDSLALTAVELIAGSLRRAYANGADVDARYDMMLASLLAGVAFGNSDIGGVHCMAEAIGGLYDTPHGVANAIYLPVVMEYNSVAVPQKFARLAAALGEDVSGLGTAQAAKRAAAAVRELADDLRIPSAAEVGVDPKDFDRLAAAAAVNVSVGSNPRAAAECDFRELYRVAHKRG
ncbi:MAG: iron-containing alcohol dehydrogenase [Actinobacteria bacterium]|nr:iron-containing alcohol dehydrogenase [Actinomycetota bacterium]